LTLRYVYVLRLLNKITALVAYINRTILVSIVWKDTNGLLAELG